MSRLGDHRPLLRRAWTGGAPMTRLERDAVRFGKGLDYDLGKAVHERIEKGYVSQGGALVGELMEACLKRGVQLLTNVRGRGLVRNGERIAGVTADTANGPQTFQAELGVVLASGGFEWNPGLVARFMGHPLPAPGSPPGNEGDGLLMAMEVGAALGNVGEAWWNLMYQVPGDLYDGRQLSRPTSDVRGLPGMILVNRRGRRFVDEAMNYNDLGKALLVFDPVAYEYQNLPAFMLFDEEFRRSYTFAFGMVSPNGADPNWLFVGDTLDEAAEEAGIDPEGLKAQVTEFNAFAVEGSDPVFHRGETSYDRYRGDPKRPTNPNLRPLGDGPYYIVPLQLGCFGTKGGPVIDEDGHVLDVRDRPIPGLYAVGNVTSSVFGPGYPGAGATLGAGLTYGYLAGRALAAERATVAE